MSCSYVPVIDLASIESENTETKDGEDNGDDDGIQEKGDSEAVSS